MAINEPIYKGLLQSDLDCAGFDLLNFSGGGGGTGHGIPAGGTAGQSLTKIDATDYNAHWSTVTGGGAAAGVPPGFHPLPSDSTVTALLASAAATRTPIATLVTGTGNYFDMQSYDPCVLVNPTDATQLIMLFSAMASGGTNAIGRATASVSDPTQWSVSSSPVLSPAGSGWEASFIRADSVIYNPADSKIYLFYSSSANVGVASSSDLGLTWTKLGQALSPTAPETSVSQFSVFLEGTTLHGLYSYRTAGATLPAYRYASATTANFLSWTKGGVDVYADPEINRLHEFHQLFKVGSTYVLAYESGSGSVNWDIRLATSSSPSSGWTISANTPFLTKSGMPEAFDEFHVATGAVVVIGGYYYILYCGALDLDQPYYSNHWQMGITPLIAPLQVPTLYIGTDARLVSLSGGVKLEVRNRTTGTWVEGTRYTNP